jgi:uncharacterized protein
VIVLGLLLGFVIGIISGLVGIGGGALAIPAMIYLFGMSQHRAQGTSIAFLLAPIGIFAFWQYFKAGNVDVRMAVLLAIGFAAGGYFGGRWAQQLPDLILKRSFAVLLILLAIQLWFKAK